MFATDNVVFLVGVAMKTYIRPYVFVMMTSTKSVAFCVTEIYSHVQEQIFQFKIGLECGPRHAWAAWLGPSFVPVVLNTRCARKNPFEKKTPVLWFAILVAMK